LGGRARGATLNLHCRHEDGQPIPGAKDASHLAREGSKKAEMIEHRSMRDCKAAPGCRSAIHKNQARFYRLSLVLGWRGMIGIKDLLTPTHWQPNCTFLIWARPE
jgi:hypothetical protein